MEARPVARTEDLYVERIEDEIVVLDARTQNAHSLTPAAARVWESCDGERTVSEIAEQSRLTLEMVADALAELATCELLENGQSEVSDLNVMSGVTRRQAAKRAAAAGGLAFAAPLIHSVVIPAAAAAASTCTDANALGADCVVAYTAPGCSTVQAIEGCIGSTCTCAPYGVCPTEYPFTLKGICVP